MDKKKVACENHLTGLPGSALKVFGGWVGGLKVSLVLALVQTYGFGFRFGLGPS